jgi:predicted AAA+ superfamily ATPase
VDDEQVWDGILDANPWWSTGQVPSPRTREFHREAFPAIYEALQRADRGRGIVLLGPRRIGKSILLHQIAARLLADGVEPKRVVLLALDDVALRGAVLGRLRVLVRIRMPLPPDTERWLLLDEIQHAPSWAGWLKRLADRRDPWRFFATGSSATALRHGGQDAGLGRWREMVLYPWSFREHVRFRGVDDLGGRALATLDEAIAEARTSLEGSIEPLPTLPVSWSPRAARALDEALVDYLVRGGFPEVLEQSDPCEAQRQLRQDILDRALGRDVVDVEAVDTRALERLFLRICQHPGGLWNASQVGSDIGISRPTVARYLAILERAFLVFSLSNLASPVRGQPKVYLVAPSLRAALLHLDHERMRAPTNWGPAVENLVATTLLTRRDTAARIGFWRYGRDEVDGVLIGSDGDAQLIESKTGKPGALKALTACAAALDLEPARSTAVVVVRDASLCRGFAEPAFRAAAIVQVTQWLWSWQATFGGTLTAT